MGERTVRFQLSTLGPGDALADDGYKFSDTDIQLVDRLLEYALERHVHTGASATDSAPPVGPTLTLHTSGGTIPASTRVYYQVSYVDPDGNETAASPAAFVDTPAAIDEPAAPALGWAPAGGSLPPGSYTYVLSAYAGAVTLETKALNPAQVRVGTTTSASQVTITMPSLPTGADGYNIYRKKPGSPRFYHLASTTATSYVDDGSVTEDPARSLPMSNATNNANAVTVTLPGATPSVPGDGYTWKIYRAYDATSWASSLVHHVVETTLPGSGPVVTTYDDVGEPTLRGGPLDAGQMTGSPPKIVLTDAANTTGSLPPGLNVTCQVVSFQYPGLAAVQQGPDVWVCNFDQADIVACRAYLGRGSMPASQADIVDVDKYDAHAATPGWDTIYTTQANRPKVEVGASVGALTVPDVTHLRQGDALSADIDQAGGGATPTDAELRVDVLLYVQHGSETQSWAWGA